MLKVKVVDTEVEIRTGTYKSGANAGKSYERKSQINVFIELNGEVRRLHLDIPEGVSTYLPGNYQIDLSKMMTVNRFNQLETLPFASPVLIPLATEKPMFSAAK